MRMIWAGHVPCMAEVKNVYKILVRKPEETDHLEDLGEDGKVILEWILGKWMGRCELVASGSIQGSMVGSHENCNEPSSSIKGREFFD